MKDLHNQKHTWAMGQVCLMTRFQKLTLLGTNISLRSTPHPLTLTTRIVTFLVGNPYKPSFATVTGWGVDPTYPLLFVTFESMFFRLSLLGGICFLVPRRQIWLLRFFQFQGWHFSHERIDEFGLLWSGVRGNKLWGGVGWLLYGKGMKNLRKLTWNL